MLQTHNIRVLKKKNANMAIQVLLTQGDGRGRSLEYSEAESETEAKSAQRLGERQGETGSELGVGVGVAVNVDEGQ